MNSLILRTSAPWLAALLVLFSLLVLLRGHNEPGGGFIGGLIGACAVAVHALAFGAPAVRRAWRVHPLSIAGAGAVLSASAGLAPLLLGRPFLRGLFVEPVILGTPVFLSTALAFDIGIYLAVVGTVTAILLALQAEPAGPAP